MMLGLAWAAVSLAWGAALVIGMDPKWGWRR